MLFKLENIRVCSKKKKTARRKRFFNFLDEENEKISFRFNFEEIVSKFDKEKRFFVFAVLSTHASTNLISVL